ncbi:MAG TPA: peptide chain release factor 2, partial [Marinobacter hydrocarbonoclasticus]|nr:peptide chain release factor 2 [Marinobacter nauticus]
TNGLADAESLLDMAVEEDDEGTVQEIEADLENLDKELEKLEFRRM